MYRNRIQIYIQLGKIETKTKQNKKFITKKNEIKYAPRVLYTLK